MQYLTLRLGLVLVCWLVSACGFGLGSFHNKQRSGYHYLGDAGNGKSWYSSESWEDVSGTYNVHLGYKVGASFASAPGRDTAWGRASEASLEGRFGRYGLAVGWSDDTAKYSDTVVGYSAFFLSGRLFLTPPAPLMFDLNVGIAQGEACTYKNEDGASGCSITGDDLAGRAGIGANFWLFGETVDIFLRIEGRLTATEKVAALADERFTSVAVISELGFQF